MSYLNINKQEAISTMNRLGSSRTPFLFYTDFQGTKSCIMPLFQCDNVEYNINGISNCATNQSPAELQFEVIPPSVEEYRLAFEEATYHLKRGDSYLLNLTFPSRILTNLTLREIFYLANAPYKLHVPGKFTVFSPETFIRIENGSISTYPMKGTIKADIEDADEILKNDKKELAEHCTIVDLMRNDLSMVSSNVRVTSFRYIDRITSATGDLLQTSSKISGKLPSEYHRHLGDILYQLLPAGSISGAPKGKTLDIIHKIENSPRDNYTGICGLYDGVRFDSGVMIRYIEDRNGELYFRSGGGITAQSDLYSEYQELLAKINVPTFRNDTDKKRQNTQSTISQ